MTARQRLERLKDWANKRFGVDIIDYVSDCPVESGIFVNLPAVKERLQDELKAKVHIKRPVIVILHTSKTRPELLIAILIHEIGHCALDHKYVEGKSPKERNQEEIDAYTTGYSLVSEEVPELSPSIDALARQLVKLDRNRNRKSLMWLEREIGLLLKFIVCGCFLNKDVNSAFNMKNRYNNRGATAGLRFTSKAELVKASKSIGWTTFAYNLT